MRFPEIGPSNSSVYFNGIFHDKPSIWGSTIYGNLRIRVSWGYNITKICKRVFISWVFFSMFNHGFMILVLSGTTWLANGLKGDLANKVMDWTSHLMRWWNRQTRNIDTENGKMRNCSDVTQFQQQNIGLISEKTRDATKNYISITINCDNLEKETR